jgi:hypothetical protein
VRVDPADSCSREDVTLDERQRFQVRRDLRLRQVEEEPEDLRTLAQEAERQLAEDERVTQDATVQKKGLETGIPTS